MRENIEGSVPERVIWTDLHCSELAILFLARYSYMASSIIYECKILSLSLTLSHTLWVHLNLGLKFLKIETFQVQPIDLRHSAILCFLTKA